MADRRLRWGIRTRITVGATAVVAVVLITGAVAVLAVLSQALGSSVATRLESELASIAAGLEEGLVPAAWIAERDDDVLIAWETADATGTATVVVNADAALALPQPPGGEPVRTVIDADAYLVVGQELETGMLLLGAPLADVEVAVATTGTILAVAVPVAVVVIGIVVWAVASRALAPVARIRRQVDAIDAHRLDRRVPVRGTGDEIDLLASTMNRMLERVEDGYAAQQRFVGDASHELRSPLASMRQFAELGRTHPYATSTTELAEVVLDEGTRMQDILEGLLLLARLDEGAVRASGVVELDELIADEAGRAQQMGAVPVEVGASAPVSVDGDARLLRRAVRNLLDNASRHARSRITVGVRSAGGRALVWVDDDGPGIDEAERALVFERFARLDDARSRDAGGSGLGLAIVREIVHAHGGRARVERAPSGGARFVIELPAAHLNP